MIKHLNIKISGQVQGVLFRSSSQIEAAKLGIRGFAKNVEDGSVYIEAEGEEEDLNKFVEWCKTGPKIAKVEKVDTEAGLIKNFKTFETI